MNESLEIAVRCIDFLTDNQQVTIEAPSPLEFQHTIDVFSSSHNKLSFIDTMLTVVARHRGLPLATFDKDLAKTYQEFKNIS